MTPRTTLHSTQGGASETSSARIPIQGLQDVAHCASAATAQQIYAPVVILASLEPIKTNVKRFYTRFLGPFNNLPKTVAGKIMEIPCKRRPDAQPRIAPASMR